MTISISTFGKLLPVTVPTGDERYVVPSASVPLTTTDDWFGYMRETLGSTSFNPADPTTFNAGFAAAYQIVDVGGAKSGASATGLLNNTTVYTASVAVEGAAHPINIVGSSAQTYATLIAQLNSAMNNDAVAAIVSGNIRFTSKKLGVDSVVAITDTNLFSTLTNYSSILTAVVGAVPFAGMAFHKLDASIDSVLMVGKKTTYDALISTGTAEVTNVTIPAAAAITTGQYWTLNSPTVSYYIWFNKDAGGGDPLVAGKTAIPVVVTTGDSANTVAIATASAIDGLAAFVCPVPGAAIIAITDAVVGTAVDAANFNAGVSVIITAQGVTALSGGYIPV